MSGYHEEDFLQLSGLQHFAFCWRQWALIHIEQQWRENLRTVEGDLFHRRAHDEQARERRGRYPDPAGGCLWPPPPWGSPDSVMW